MATYPRSKGYEIYLCQTGWIPAQSEKYKKDYANAIVQLKTERSRVESELSKIKGVTGHSSQAAFVWVEFGDEISVDDVESQLLRQNHILVKKTDGNSKTIRFSIHTEDENDKMKIGCGNREESIGEENPNRQRRNPCFL